VRTRIKTLGAFAAVAAIALSIPTAVNAYGDPTTPVPVPVAKIPDPQGSGCDAYKNKVPAGAGSFLAMSTQSASQAIASNPDLSTFSAAISGGLNPEVNLVSVLDNGPYIVFAPTNDAFAKIDPAELDALKANPAELTSVLYYHMVLGYLDPDEVHGKLTTQQGSLITVTGKGGDIKIDDTAKVVCGGITAKGAQLYMIDTVLNPANSLGATATSSTSATTTTTTTSAPETTASAAVEAPAAEAPAPPAA
jgi:uncharacterized surface protein with fasciclin (FAS1) repeats